MVEVKRWFLDNPLRNYNYLLVNQALKSCVIIDPTLKQHYQNYIADQGLKVEAILLTHEHADHTAAAQCLKAQYGCKTYARFKTYKDGDVDECVSDGAQLNFKTATIDVIAVPGHTINHVCFYVKAHKILFTGDTLFAAGVGGLRDPSADLTSLYHSIQKLSQLPEDVYIYSAHDYFENNLAFALSIDPDNTHYLQWYNRIKQLDANNKPITALADEKEMNIFLHSDSVHLKTRLSQQIANASQQAVFRYLRKQKDVF